MKLFYLHVKFYETRSKIYFTINCLTTQEKIASLTRNNEQLEILYTTPVRDSSKSSFKITLYHTINRMSNENTKAFIKRIHDHIHLHHNHKNIK